MIKPERVHERLEALARFVDPQRPPFTRRAFTDVYLEGRDWLASEFAAAGLEVRRDEGANLSGRRLGTRPGTGTIMIGSHIDTVVGGGRFDGAAGVIIGIEVAQALAERRVTLAHDLEIVDFLSEEPSDYGVSCVGSRAMVGTLDQTMLVLENQDGEPLSDAIARMGGSPQKLRGALRPPGEVAAFLELHIEQGPVLEATRTDIGIVTGIVGIRRVELVVTGQADHAGTTPMKTRSDALVSASELVLAARRLADTMAQTSGLVATIGKLTVSPNVANVVPGRVTMVLEIRSTESSELDTFLSQLDHIATTISGTLSVAIRPLSNTAPVPCDPRVRRLLWGAVEELGLSGVDMPSGAGHDAAILGAICPTAMIFVPSVAGRSHVPEEHTDLDDLVNGAAVLLESVLALDATL